jgi:hypothetical protein
VSELVENTFKRTRPGFLQRKNDEILVASAVKKRGKVGRFTLINRQERLHGGVIRERKNDERRRSHSLSTRQQRIGSSELPQPRRYPRHVLSRSATVHMEMARALFQPGPVQERKGFGTSPDFEDQSVQSEQEPRPGHTNN